MRNTRIALAAIMLSALVAGTALAGGQASVTILKAPKEAVAGKAFVVAFTVTPNWPMDKNRSLEPTVKAVCGDRVVTLAAVALKTAGHSGRVALRRGRVGHHVDSRFCRR
jgi:hypothetical protein